jgi:sensor histidine kinase regulating citrate/malate metabolism
MLLETVLVNLLDNAIKHGEGAEHVWASVKMQDKTIVFEVVDDGVGIPVPIFSIACSIGSSAFSAAIPNRRAAASGYRFARASSRRWAARSK